jgi:hypothetical protein
VWEDFHKCCSNFSIAKRTKSRWAETLKVEGESFEAEEDANILLMLKKTPESSPRNDVSEKIVLQVVPLLSKRQMVLQQPVQMHPR